MAFASRCLQVSELESFLSAEVKRALVRSKWHFGMVKVALWYDQSGTLVGQSGALGVGWSKWRFGWSKWRFGCWLVKVALWLIKVAL